MKLKEAIAKATHGKLRSFKTYLIDEAGVVICKMDPTFSEKLDTALLAHCFNHFNEVVELANEMFKILEGRECSGEPRWRKILSRAKNVEGL